MTGELARFDSTPATANSTPVKPEYRHGELLAGLIVEWDGVNGMAIARYFPKIESGLLEPIYERLDAPLFPDEIRMIRPQAPVGLNATLRMGLDESGRYLYEGYGATVAEAVSNVMKFISMDDQAR